LQRNHVERFLQKNQGGHTKLHKFHAGFFFDCFVVFLGVSQHGDLFKQNTKNGAPA
jgi:hypothetical protein